MWFGILTPGAHPCRPTPTATDATVYAWSAPERVRVDGPAATVHDGLRLLRRRALDGAGASEPRCFACRLPYDLPDGDAVRRDPELPELDAAAVPASAEPVAPAPAPASARRARFFLVHVQDADAAEGEEALVVAPGSRVALLVPLAVLPHALEVLELALGDAPDPCCEACGASLPGSCAERDAQEGRAATRRPLRRRAHGGRRRAA